MTSQTVFLTGDNGSALPKMEKEERREIVNDLKSRDNTTNFYYLAQVYLILIGTVALTIWSYGAVASAGLGWWWNIPATLISIFVMGATQHQFGGVVHEGTHHILFKDRVLNEVVSDWLAAFPIFTSTYRFRLHHLAHHQFVNDPERDPNFEMSRDGGHWLDFPVEHIELLMGIGRMLWVPNLLRYIKARAQQSSIGGDSNPYVKRVRAGSPWPIRVGIGFIVGAPFVMLFVQLPMGYVASFVALGVMIAACTIYYLLVPDSAFQESRLDPVVSHRVTAISWVVYMAIVYGGLSAAEFATGHPAWLYFGLLWIIPIFTTFPLFMILREWLQHGNGDRGRYTNSRILLFNPVMRYAVMPWGMDYHLPHHLVAAVPHYKLSKLHNFLLNTDPQYAKDALVVEGWSRQRDSSHPTIVQVLGPEFARQSGDIHVPTDTLAYSDVNDPKGIADEEAASRLGSGTSAQD